MSDNTAIDNAVDNPGTVFPFFKLPRELRDSIYEKALVPFRNIFEGTRHQAQTGLCDIQMIVINSARPHLFLVNHEFATEDRERAAHLACLTIGFGKTRGRGEWKDPRWNALPAGLKYIRRMDLHILSTVPTQSVVSLSQYYAGFGSEIEARIGRVRKLLAISGILVDTFSYAVYVQRDCAFRVDEIKGRKVMRTPFEGLKSMGIYAISWNDHVRFRLEDFAPRFIRNEAKLLMSCNLQSGRFEVITDAAATVETEE